MILAVIVFHFVRIFFSPLNINILNTKMDFPMREIEKLSANSQVRIYLFVFLKPYLKKMFNLRCSFMVM